MDLTLWISGTNKKYWSEALAPSRCTFSMTNPGKKNRIESLSWVVSAPKILGNYQFGALEFWGPAVRVAKLFFKKTYRFEALGLLGSRCTFCRRIRWENVCIWSFGALGLQVPVLLKKSWGKYVGLKRWSSWTKTTYWSEALAPGSHM